jgi:hypothetical protein
MLSWSRLVTLFGIAAAVLFIAIGDHNALRPANEWVNLPGCRAPGGKNSRAALADAESLGGSVESERIPSVRCVREP